MKNLLLTFFVVLCTTMVSQAQGPNPDGNYNPYLAEGIISPAPLLPLEFNGSGVVQFKVGNSGSDALLNVLNQEMGLTLTLSGGVPNVTPLNATSALDAIGGTYAAYFNWTYDMATNTFQGKQNQTIPAGGVGYVNIQYKVTVNSPKGGAQNGFNVNLVPPAYANTSNSQNDDQVSSFTWTDYRDYGDAPVIYGSVDHEIDYVNFLGALVDGEQAYPASAQANADDLTGQDDEDGVVFPAMVQGSTVNIAVTGTGVGYLSAWLDWNGDGDFADAGEKIATNTIIVNTTVNVSVTVPYTAISTQPTFARFRYGASGLASSGTAVYGEVEDYQVSIVCTPPATPLATLTQPTCAVATGSIAVTAPLGADFEYSINGTAWQASPLFSGLTPAQSYTVLVRNKTRDLACYSSASFDIAAALETPAAPAVTLVQPTCTVATGSITVTAPLGAGYTYSVNGTTYQAGVTFSALASGSYNVTAKNAAGCVSSATVAVITPAPAAPTAPAVTLEQPTCAVPTGSIIVTAPLGTGYTYSINGTVWQPSTLFSALTAGSYSVTAKSADGCVSSATVAVITPAPAAPTAPAVTLVQPTCAVATGSITVTAPLGAGYTYSINGTTYQSGVTFNALVPGSYTVIAKSADGCVSAATAAVINPQPLTPAAPAVTLVQPTCAVATGSITVTAPLGTGITYSINATTYQAGVTFNGVPPGSYTVTAKSADGCISATTAAVINAQPLTQAAPAVALVQPTCAVATGSITVTAPTGNGITFSINGTTYQAGATFNAVAAGSYNVTVKNSDGCVSAVTVAVINAQPLTPAAPAVTLVQPTCTVATGSITVTAPLGAGYTYSVNGTTYQAGVTFSALASGSYNVTAKNAAGCVSSATVAVITPAPAAPAAPTVTLVQPTCAVATGSITVTAPLGAGYTYSINGTTYQSGVTFNALVPGSYTVTAKSADGCVSAATAAVINAVPQAPVAPVVGAITQPTCQVVTGSVVLSGLPAGNWTINPGGITGSTTSKTITGLIPGTYQFTVTTAAGCISLPSAPVKIDDAPVLTVFAGDDVEICAGSGITLSATTNVPANISWTPATGLSNPAIPNPVASPLVTTTYTVSATIPATNLITNPGFESGYTGFTSQYTQVAATNYYNGTNTSGLIPEGTYIVTGNPYSGYPGAPQGYHNDFNEAPKSGTSQLVVNGFTTTGKVVWSTTIPVFPNSDMTFSFWHVKLNHGADATLRVRVNNVNDPTPVVIVSDTYTKATRTLNTGTATSLTISLVDDNTIAGGNDFAIDDVSLTYDCPGAATDQVIVSVYQIAEPVVTVVQPTCSVATGSVTVTAPVGTGVQYSLDGGAYTSTTTFGLLKPGTYSVTAKNAAGCVSSATVAVINPAPAPSAAPAVTLVQPTCAVAAGSITVTAPLGTGITYSIGGAYQAGTTFNALAPGTYNVTAKSADGCVSAATVSVINAQPATPATPALALTQPGCGETTGTITVTAPAGAAYTYSINGADYQTSPVFTSLLPGTYTMTVKSSQCVSAATPAVINKGGVIPNVQAGTDMAIGCSIQQVTLEGSSTSAGVTFAWVASNGGHIVSGADTPKPLVNAAGTYTLTVTDKVTGCTATDVALVTGGGLPPVLELLDAYCVFLNKDGKWTLNAAELATITAGSHAWKGTWQDLTFNFSKKTFECKDAIGPYVQVMVTATDLGGCTTSGMFEMQVLDTISPVANCIDISVQLDAAGQVLVVPGMVNDGGDRENVPAWAKYFKNLEGGSYDNCGIAEMYLDKTIFTREDVGKNLVWLTVVDPSGNTAECQATVTVTDPFATNVEEPGAVANTAPTLDDITDIDLVKEPLSFDVALTNITAGTEAAQLVAVTAVTDNPSVLTNLQVVYQAGSSTGKLLVTVAPGVSGEATVFVTVKDNGGILNGGLDTTVKSFKVKITAGEEQVAIEITDPSGTPVITSVIGIHNPFSFDLYPNPTQNKVTIEMKGLKVKDTEVRLFSILGTEVYRKMYKSANLITLDLSPYVSGVYVVQLRTGNESFLRKVVLEK